MVSVILSRLVILVFGLLYPAYASYKAVKTKNIKEYVKWMMYWIVFALFTAAETFSDVFLSWLPFYYEIKMVFVFWLLSPVTQGSSFLYKKFVHPQLLKREKEIDEAIAQARTRGYSTIMSLGHKGLTYATNVVVKTAIKGQSTLVERVRSYSTNDLRLQGDRRGEDEIDARYIDDSDEEFERRLQADNRELEERGSRENVRKRDPLRRKVLTRSQSDATEIRQHRAGRALSGLSRLDEVEHEHSYTSEKQDQEAGEEEEEGEMKVEEEIIYYNTRTGGHYTTKEDFRRAKVDRTMGKLRPSKSLVLIPGNNLDQA